MTNYIIYVLLYVNKFLYCKNVFYSCKQYNNNIIIMGYIFTVSNTRYPTCLPWGSFTTLFCTFVS